MSLRARFLNVWLRLVEKPRLQQAAGPDPLRRNFERQARVLFHPPRGVDHHWDQGALRLRPKKVLGARTLLYLHGGAFVFGSPRTHSALVAQVAKRVNAQAFVPKYRLAPENPFPAAFDDAVAAWDDLIAQGVPANQIALGGDSAGGCLAFALLQHLIAAGGPMPAAVFAFSPLTDMTYSGDSFRSNAQAEAFLSAERANELGQYYLAGHDAQDARVSPLNGVFDGAPPVWVCAGNTEILLDDTRRMVSRLKAQGVDVTCRIADDLPHVWPLFHNFLPEARDTLDDLAAWLRPRFGTTAES